MRNKNKADTVNRVFKLLGLTFTIVGAIVLLVGLGFAVNGFLFLNKAETTSATLSRYEHANGERYSYRTYYSYEIDGKEYKDIPMNYYSSSDYEGKKVTLYYDPQNPMDARPKWSLFLGSMISVPLGLIFFIIGLSFTITMRKKVKRKRRLLESGQIIYAQYQGTSKSTYRVNGRYPFHIECSYVNPLDGKTYLFKSESLWFNPEPMIQSREIPIYVNRDNYGEYYVDVRPFTETVVDYR